MKIIKSFPIILSILLLLGGCIDHTNDQVDFDNQGPMNSIRTELKIDFAQGFELIYQDQNVKIKTNSFDENTVWRDSMAVIYNTSVENYKKAIQPSKNLRFACQSSTHLSFLKALGAEDNLCGLCGVEYVTNPDLKEKIEENEVVEICQGEGLMQEAILTAQPDIYLRYPFQSDFDPEDIAINSLYIAEYLEKTPLARLEWIKLFGVLIGKEAEAAQYFDDISMEYISLKKNTENFNQTFIMNLPYQDDWYMPASNSLVVNLMGDAGLNYFYAADNGTENILHPKEAVWSDGGKADYWIIIAARPADFNLNQLIAEDPAYKTFKSVKEKKVIFCNTATVPYFTTGVLEPNVMLNDLRFATGQLMNHQPIYFQLLE